MGLWWDEDLWLFKYLICVSGINTESGGNWAVAEGDGVERFAVWEHVGFREGICSKR
jgi:hypothetical protein